MKKALNIVRYAFVSLFSFLFIGSACADVAEIYQPFMANFADRIMTITSTGNANAGVDISGGSGAFVLFDPSTGADTTTTFTGNQNTSSLPGYTGSTAAWRGFCDTQAGYVAPGLVMRFSPYVAGRSITVAGTFSPFNLGGLVVEEGASSGSTIPSLTQGGSRTNKLGDTRENGGVPTFFVLRDSFKINRNGFVYIYGDITFDIANDKYFDCNTANSAQPVALQPGAIFRMLGEGTFKVSTLTATGSVTLDYSKQSTQRATQFINGNLTIDTSTKFRFPADLAVNARYQLCSGTLTGGAERAATIYVGSEEKDVTLHFDGNEVYYTEATVLNYTTEASISTILNDAGAATTAIVNFSGTTPTLTIDAAVTIPLEVRASSASSFTLVKGSEYTVTDADIEKLTIDTDGIAKLVYRDLAIIPTSAPAAGKTYRWEGTVALDTIPYAGSAFAGTIELACPVTAVDGDDQDASMSGAKGLVVFDKGFSLTTGERVSLGGASGSNQSYVQNGGKFELTSDAVPGGCGVTPIVLARWPVTVNYDLKAGQLLAENGTVQNWDGSFYLTIGDADGDEAAIFKAKGFAINRSHESIFTILKNGTFAIGANGINTGSYQSFKLNGGTLDAYAAVNYTFGSSIQVLSASTINVADGATLTISGAISGSGNVTKTGLGKLVITGSLADYTGVITATEGVIDMTDATPISDGSLARFAGNVMINADGTKWIKIATGVSAVPAGITFFGTTATALDQTKLFVKNDELYFGEDGATTYSFTDGDKVAMEAMAQGDIYRPTILSINNTGFDAATVPEGYLAWTDDSGLVYAAKKSNSISIKFTPEAADRGTIAATDAKVGGYPVAGKFWNHSKNCTQTGSGTTEIFELMDGNGEALVDGDGNKTLCYYYMPNMYDVNKTNVNGRNKQTTGNGKLTYSYFDDSNRIEPQTWPYSVGTTEDGTEYFLPETPTKEGITANLRWEVAIANIPYQMFDLYIYQASDQTTDSIKLLPIAVKANNGEWKYFAGDGKGSTEVANYDSIWDGASYCDSETMVEGTNYIRYRMSKAALGLGADEKIEVVYLSHPRTHDSARLGLAGVQLVEVENDGYYTRNPDAVSADWTAADSWLNSSDSEITWTNPTGKDVAYATIDTDEAVDSKITVDSDITATLITLKNAAPADGAPEKVFTIDGSGTLTAPIDATGFYGKIVVIAPVNGTLTLGDNARYEINVPQGVTKSVDELLPAGMSIVGNITIVGAGTIVVEDTLPTACQSGFQANTWTGTLYLKNIAWNSFGFGAYGHAGSKIKVTGITGYGPNSTADGVNPELILEDSGDTKAILINDGFGGKDYFFSKVSGSGTFAWDADSTKSPNGPIYIFRDVSDFDGVLDAGPHLKIVVGNTTAGTDKGSITFADGITVKAGLGWMAQKAYFGETLTVKGALGDTLVEGLTAAPETVPVVTLDGVQGVYTLKYTYVEGNGGKLTIAYSDIEITQDSNGHILAGIVSWDDGYDYFDEDGIAKIPYGAQNVTVTYMSDFDNNYVFSTGTNTYVFDLADEVTEPLTASLPSGITIGLAVAMVSDPEHPLDSKFYPALADAIERVDVGGTISMIGDDAASTTVAKSVTIDVNGYEINVVATAEADTKITFGCGGTVGGTVTVDGGTVNFRTAGDMVTGKFTGTLDYSSGTVTKSDDYEVEAPEGYKWENGTLVKEQSDWPGDWPEADDDVKAAFVDWTTTYGVTDFTGKEDAFLLNVDPEEALPAFKIESIEVEGSVATVVISIEGKDFETETINGKLFVSAGDKLEEMADQPFSFEVVEGKAIGSVEAKFIAAKIGFKGR